MNARPLVRRLRAVLVLAMLWAIGWFVIGVAFGLYQYYAGWPIASINFSGLANPLLAVVLSYAFGAAKGGAISGALFATLLMIAERNQSAANLTLGRSAIWGVLGAILVPITMLGIMLIRFPFLLSDFPLVPFIISWFVLGVLGAGCALLTVWLGRRGINQELPAAAALTSGWSWRRPS